MEFVNARSYASLRFMDVFNRLNSSPSLKLSQKEFYDRLREKIKTMQLIGDQEIMLKPQNELLQM